MDSGSSIQCISSNTRATFGRNGWDGKDKKDKELNQIRLKTTISLKASGKTKGSLDDS